MRFALVAAVLAALATAGAAYAEGPITPNCGAGPNHTVICTKPQSVKTPGQPFFVTERYLEAQLEKRYDFASCFGISRYGTRAFRTGDYSWTKAFTRFQCSYDTGTTSCYRAEVSIVKGAKPGWWNSVTVRQPECY